MPSRTATKVVRLYPFALNYFIIFFLVVREKQTQTHYWLSFQLGPLLSLVFRPKKRGGVGRGGRRRILDSATLNPTNGFKVNWATLNIFFKSSKNLSENNFISSIRVN